MVDDDAVLWPTASFVNPEICSDDLTAAVERRCSKCSRRAFSNLIAR